VRGMSLSSEKRAHTRYLDSKIPHSAAIGTARR
jgi:hypothetical protein